MRFGYCDGGSVVMVRAPRPTGAQGALHSVVLPIRLWSYVHVTPFIPRLLLEMSTSTSQRLGGARAGVFPGSSVCLCYAAIWISGVRAPRRAFRHGCRCARRTVVVRPDMSMHAVNRHLCALEAADSYLLQPRRVWAWAGRATGMNDGRRSGVVRAPSLAS